MLHPEIAKDRLSVLVANEGASFYACILATMPPESRRQHVMVLKGPHVDSLDKTIIHLVRDLRATLGKKLRDEHFKMAPDWTKCIDCTAYATSTAAGGPSKGPADWKPAVEQPPAYSGEKSG
jgi:hypothetical protein